MDNWVKINTIVIKSRKYLQKISVDLQFVIAVFTNYAFLRFAAGEVMTLDNALSQELWVPPLFPHQKRVIGQGVFDGLDSILAHWSASTMDNVLEGPVQAVHFVDPLFLDVGVGLRESEVVRGR